MPPKIARTSGSDSQCLISCSGEINREIFGKISNSLLFGQMKADRKVSSRRDIHGWHREFINAMSVAGWSRGSSPAFPVPQERIGNYRKFTAEIVQIILDDERERAQARAAFEEFDRYLQSDPPQASILRNATSSMSSPFSLIGHTLLRGGVVTLKSVVITQQAEKSSQFQLWPPKWVTEVRQSFGYSAFTGIWSGTDYCKLATEVEDYIREQAERAIVSIELTRE